MGVSLALMSGPNVNNKPTNGDGRGNVVGAPTCQLQAKNGVARLLKSTQELAKFWQSVAVVATGTPVGPDRRTGARRPRNLR